jgi:putative transposase
MPVYPGAHNHQHRHAALGLHTPASVYYGTAPQIRAHRAIVLDRAYAANPQRFARPPTPPMLPAVAWINQPTPEALIQTR